MSYSQVAGSSVWLLQWIAGQSGANITFDVVRLPWEVYYSSSLNNNTNDTAARVIYLLEELGYDCVAGAAFVWPMRMQFMRYILPHQPYGYQVVTNTPVWAPEGLFSRLFKFGKPFASSLWGVLVASVVASGFIMMYYERNTGSDDFPVVDESIRSKLMRGLFLACMGITLLAFFNPRTHEGRVYTSVKAFVIFVLMSSYIAQYSAIQNSLPSPVQPVTSIDSFASLGKPICVRQISAQINWVSANYPGLVVKPIAGLTQLGLLRAITTGQCVGGIGPDVEIKYGMGGPGIDAACGLTTVGDTLNFGYYGIPFHKNDTATVNPATLAALDVYVNEAIDSGVYRAYAQTLFPDPSDRPSCTSTETALAAEVMRIKSGQLQLKDMAGLFIVQGGGLFLSMLVHFGRLRLEKHRAAARAVAERQSAQGRQAEVVKNGDLDGEEEYDSSDMDMEEAMVSHRIELHESVIPTAISHGGSEARLAQLILQNTCEVDELRRSLHMLTSTLTHEIHAEARLRQRTFATQGRGQEEAAEPAGGNGAAHRGVSAALAHMATSRHANRIVPTSITPHRLLPQGGQT